MAKTKKYGPFTGMQWIIVAIIGIALISISGGGNILGFEIPEFNITGTQQPVEVPPAQQVPSELIGTCEQSTAINVTYSIFDSIKNGTSLNTDYNIVYYENGVYKGTTSAGSTITAASGSTLTMYLTDSDATHDVYGFVDSVQVGCVPLTLQSTRGMQDGTLSLIVYQSDDVTANTAGAPETLGAGATAQGRLRIKENTDDAYWSTTEGGQKFLIVADINKNAFSNFEVQSVSNGSAVQSTVPVAHTSTDSTNNQLAVAYEVTSDALRDYGIVDVWFRAEALGSINPGTDSNIFFTIFDKEMYQNTVNGSWVIDYANAVTNADIGETNATDTYHIA